MGMRRDEGGGASPGSLGGLSPSFLCAVHIVADAEMAEVAALLCKWALDAVQLRLLLAVSPRWMSAAVVAVAVLAPSRLIQSRLIGITVDS